MALGADSETGRERSRDGQVTFGTLAGLAGVS